MGSQDQLTPQEIAVRAHDITVCLERTSVSEFDELTKLGKAVRLALHLRGVPAVSYSLLREVAIHLLDFHPDAVRPVVELLAEAEFVQLDTEGKTIKTVIPDVPFYEALFSNLGEVVGTNNFSEPEALTISLLHRLASSPMLADHAYTFGADRSLVNRIIDIGTQGAFIVNQRARGKSVLVSPTLVVPARPCNFFCGIATRQNLRTHLLPVESIEGWVSIVCLNDLPSFMNKLLQTASWL